MELKGRRAATENDFNYTLTIENINYKNKTVNLVNIKDIIGTFAIWDTKDLSDVPNDNTKNETNTIQLLEEDGKYYIIKDNNNKAIESLKKYYSLKENSKNNPEEIAKLDELFKIEAEVIKKSGFNMIDKICFCLSKVWNDDIKINFNCKKGLAEVKVCGQTYIINQEEEFVGIFNYYLSKLNKKSKYFEDLNAWLVRVGYPNKVDNATEAINNRELVDKETLLKVKEYLESTNTKENETEKQNVKVLM